MNLEEAALKKKLETGRLLLLKARGKRVRPLLDDKIILGWNALMNTAVSKAFAATGHLAFRELAIRNMEFLLLHFKAEKGYHHTWKAGQAKVPAFLDDYACLIDALIHLQEITGNRDWLLRARELTAFVQAHIREEGTGFFYYTPDWQEDVILRKKEVYDGATPSGNALMALNLYRLGILYHVPEWKEQSASMLATLGNAITKYPTSFGCWACMLQEQISGTHELALVGNGFEQVLHEVLRAYIPHRVLMAADRAVPEYPLLAGRTSVSRVSLYRCSNYTCQLPVFSAKELISLIDRDKKA